jgi:putative ABC transport system permease protein
VWKAFGTIALILATLGLYGLITLNVAGRLKEFNIRKILGAGLPDLTRYVAQQYILLYAVGLAVGAPVSYYLNQTLFDRIYRYHMPITYSGVVVACTILLTVLFVTIVVLVRKVMQSNAVESIKAE